jgi:pyridoxamine 5'-phosphate oxidase
VTNLADIRREYARAGLAESAVAADPVEQLQRWLAETEAADPHTFTSMVLATADHLGKPSARVVLLKGLDARGLVFYTNYESRKGRELAANPQAALLFHWEPFERQVRVEGRVERTSREESEAYFHSRPRGSQISAAVSPQSALISGREVLERAAAELEERLAGAEVPLPEEWGGFRLIPEVCEFWQGRTNRLHDRLVYRRQRRQPDGGWHLERLAP